MALTVRQNTFPRIGVGRPTHASMAASRDDLARPDDSQQLSFGAVYEYRDSHGRPQYVGSSGQQPEITWREDYQRTMGVRELARSGGSATVVWAGVGRAPCVGPEEMQAAREAVASDRATRQRICELRGAKPYSRHSHLLAGS